MEYESHNVWRSEDPTSQRLAAVDLVAIVLVESYPRVGWARITTHQHHNTFNHPPLSISSLPDPVLRNRSHGCECEAEWKQGVDLSSGLPLVDSPAKALFEEVAADRCVTYQLVFEENGRECIFGSDLERGCLPSLSGSWGSGLRWESVIGDRR